MALIPYRRRSELAPGRLEDEMSDLFNRFFGNWQQWPFAAGRYWPALDVSERDDAVVVRAETPGMKPEDIDISVQGNTLTISGEKSEREEDKGEDHYVSERRYGSFRRAVSLPSEVDSEKVQAECKDGVLTVTLPKSEKARAKRIPVKG